MDLASGSTSTVPENFNSKTRNFAILVNDQHTEILLTHFPNYVNLIVTQFGKIGNLYQVKIDQPGNGLAIAEPVYSISTVLGAENIQAEVAVRYLSEKLNIKKPLLVCLALKDYSRDSLNIIIDSISNYGTTKN